jgi:hypothetical protein
MNSLGANSSQVNILNTLGGGGFTGILSDDLDADGYSILNASGYNFIGNNSTGLTTDSLGNLLFNGHIVDASITDDALLWSTFPAIQNVNISGFQLKNLKAGSDASDAVIVAQLSSNLAGYLPLTGGTMTGSIAMSSSNITGIDTTSTRVLNTDVLNGKSANIIATNSILDMGNQSIQNANTVTATNLQGNLYSNSITSVNQTSPINVNVPLDMGDGGNIDMGLNYRIVNLPTTLGGPNDSISVSQAQALVNQTNHTISGVFTFAQPIYVNGILAQSSDITGVDNITAISMNVDSIQANQGGGVVFNAPVVLTNPQTGVLQSIQGANSITCKTIDAATSISLGNITMGTGGFNMFQGVISNLADTTQSQPTNAVNYQTMASFHTTTNLTADGPLLMGTQPVISHNAPSVSGHLINLHHFEKNTTSSNTFYINDNKTDIQEVYNDHSNRQGITFKISSGSYGGSTLTITNSHNQLFECSHPGNGGTITELASRGLTILNSSRIRFTGLQVEGPLIINGNWPTVNTNHVFSCCEFLSGVTLGNLSAITGFITFHKCTFAGSAITYNTGTATVYFDQCDFGNTPIVNSGLATRIIVSNAAGLNSLTQSNYVGYGILTNTEGLAYNSANSLVTPLNATSIQSAQIEVNSNPSSANALTRKLYVDTALSGKLTSISAGENITIDYTNPLVPVISSTGGGGGGGQNQSNVGFAYARLSYTEIGPLALPLGAVADFSFNIYDQHFGDNKVSINGTNQLVIQTGGTATSRTFEILVQFKLSTNVGTTNAGPIGFYMADYSGAERFLIGFFKPQVFINSNQNIYYSEKFSVTLPYSASNKTYTPYIAGSTGEWQGSVTSWQISDLKIDYHYYGHTALPSPTAEAWTPPITAQPSITAISAANAGEINVSYSAVTGATEYLIYRSTDNSTYTLAGSTANLSFTLTGLQSSTLYYVKVSAGNDEGEGPRSVASSITTIEQSGPTSFSDYWADGRAAYTNFGGSYIHGSTDQIMTVGVIAKLGSGPMAIYMNRREDSGGWATGQQHSPVTIKNGFPGAGGPIMGEYTRAQLIAAGGGCLFGIQVDGRE